MRGIRNNLSRLGLAFWIPFLVWLVILCALLMAGCLRVVNEPALTFPNRPLLRFEEALDGGVCLSEEDSNALLRFILQLNEYQSARERLLNP